MTSEVGVAGAKKAKSKAKKAVTKRAPKKKKAAVKPEASPASVSTPPAPAPGPELPWPLWAPSQVEDDCKYVRLVSGQILFVDPGTGGSHADAVRAALGLSSGLARPPTSEVYSAGWVEVSRESRTVKMGSRDSRTLGVRSAPGDDDARAVAAFLFPSP